MPSMMPRVFNSPRANIAFCRSKCARPPNFLLISSPMSSRVAVPSKSQTTARSEGIGPCYRHIVRKVLILLLAGCATPLPAPDQPGARDAYRAVLAQGSKGPRVREARERLEAAEWDSARAAHTVFAYRRFLKEFGDSRHTVEARQLLEGLRWTAAERDGTEAALAGYLEDEPRGAHATDAWGLLSSLRLGSALRGGNAVS